MSDDFLSRLGRRFIWPLILGAAVFLALSVYGDLGAIASAIAGFSPALLAAVLGLTLVNYFFRFLKWHYFLGRLEIELGFGMSAVIFFSGLTMSISPGKFGEVIKSLLLKSINGTPIARSAPIVGAERLTDFLALMILSASGAATYRYGGWVLSALSAAIVAGLAALAWRPLMLRLIAAAEKAPLIGRHADKLAELYESARALATFRSLALSTLLSVASWWMECLGFYLVVRELGGEGLGLEKATFIYAFATIVGAISMLPGGLGLTEGSMTGMMALMTKVSASVSVAATLLIRLCTLWFSVLLGGLVLFTFRGKFSPEALNESQLKEDPTV